MLKGMEVQHKREAKAKAEEEAKRKRERERAMRCSCASPLCTPCMIHSLLLQVPHVSLPSFTPACKGVLLVK